jgi:rhodanese-related sulfurtransferase
LKYRQPEGETVATEVTIDDLADAISHGAYVLDVREQEEYDEVHVPGVVLIPLGQLEDRITEVEDGSRVFVICRSGARSLKGADILEANGIDAVSVAGGTLGWISSGRATE